MIRALLMSLAVLWAGSAFAKPLPPTTAQLAAFPAMASFTLSPDGKHMAALQGRGENRVILVWDTANLAAAPTVIGATQMKIEQVVFAKNDTLAVILWQPLDFHGDVTTLTFTAKLFLTDLQGRTWREPLAPAVTNSDLQDQVQAVTRPDIIDVLPNDPDHILVRNDSPLASDRGDASGDVYRVDVHTASAERVLRGADNLGDYTTDLQGVVRARTRAYVDSRGAYIATEFRDPKTGAWEEHFRSYARDRDVNRIIGFTKDPNVALLLTNVGRDKQVIYEYDIDKRAKGDLLFEHRFFEASGASIEARQGPYFGEINGLLYNGPRGGDVQWTSPRYQALDGAIRKALNIPMEPLTFVDTATGQKATGAYDSHLYYEIAAHSADLKTLVIALESPDRPAVYYLLKDGKLSMLGKEYPDLDPAAFGTTNLVYYKARDGLDIPAFLTTPNPALCGPGPWRTVVHPHGGPWSRDEMRFDWSMWVPMMSSRCIAVLRPQYRGSDGWGRRLWKAGDAEWGQKMQDDKDDGARWLVAQGIAQPDHIGIFGFSYGGYAAYAASVREGGPFKCAIAGAGVSNIHKIFEDFYENPFFRQGQKSTIDGLNPIDHADHLTMPLMVYAGDRDTTVPWEQSHWFYDKAKAAHQPIEAHFFKDYAHGPAWTRKTFGDQLQIIDDYWSTGCGGHGL